MELSIFEVLGPVMIGPSSSHTAGAARLARVAALIAKRPFKRVKFNLSGSFARTGQGHGTRQALLAGAMTLREDDERIRDIDALAEEAGVIAEYGEEELDDLHENSAHFIFYHTDGTVTQIWGSSIGGGRILLRRIGELDVSIGAESPTLLVSHKDRPGMVSRITRVLADMGINIAILRLSRREKGETATLVVETDDPIPQQVIMKLQEIAHVTEVILIDVS